MDKNTDEGIVTVVAAPEHAKDAYHITSGVHDVLILEICKSQITKESVVDCLETQQQQLMTNHKFTVMDYVGASFFAITLFLICLSCIKYLLSKKGD